MLGRPEIVVWTGFWLEIQCQGRMFSGILCVRYDFSLKFMGQVRLSSKSHVLGSTFIGMYQFRQDVLVGSDDAQTRLFV